MAPAPSAPSEQAERWSTDPRQLSSVSQQRIGTSQRKLGAQTGSLAHIPDFKERHRIASLVEEYGHQIAEAAVAAPPECSFVQVPARARSEGVEDAPNERMSLQEQCQRQRIVVHLGHARRETAAVVGHDDCVGREIVVSVRARQRFLQTAVVAPGGVQHRAG